MNKLYFIKNPELFQGEKYLYKNNYYFEGWYFKNIVDNKAIAFIPGINIEGKNKKVFIQVITNTKSYYLNYNIENFKFNEKPFYIQIKNNLFSKEKIHIDIEEKEQNIRISGDIEYINSENISVNNISPNIMGPFAYIPFMECKHAILSMKNTTIGRMTLNNESINFNGGIGYIEKDWGVSFPKSYIWCQGNNFKNKNVSFMLAIANIPFKMFEFKGIICDIIIDKKEYKFTTYNNTKLKNYVVNDKEIYILLKKGNYYLSIKGVYDKRNILVAPVKGKMQKNIIETITATISITLKKKERVIFFDTSNNCGMEIV